MCTRKQLRDSLTQHQRPTRIADVAGAFSTVLSISASDIGFLPLVETEELRHIVVELIRAHAPHVEFSLVDRHAIEEWALDVSSKLLTSSRSVLFHEQDRLVGAIWLPPEVAVQKLWAMKDCALIHDLLLTSRTGRTGLCLDFGYYLHDGTYDALGVCQAYQWACPEK